MNSLLEINKYLPENLRTTNINKLILLVNNVFANSYLLSSFSKEVNLSIDKLPSDVQMLFVEVNHPYYMKDYFVINKHLWNIYNSSVYNILKKWCYPDYSISKIEEMIPNATIDNAIELSLVYSPIPESVKYWDRITLFYHACRLNYEINHCVDIIRRFINDSDTILQHIFWICYKFERRDILSNIEDIMTDFINFETRDISDKYIMIELIRSIIKTKLKMPNDYVPVEGVSYVDIFESIVNISMNGFFTYREIVELTVIFQKMGLFEPEYPDAPIYQGYHNLIFGLYNSAADDSEYAIAYSAHQIGNEEIQKILDDYQMEKELQYDHSKYPLRNRFALGRFILNTELNESYDVIVTPVVEPGYDWTNYLVQGNFESYIRYGKDNIEDSLSGISLSELAGNINGKYSKASFNSKLLYGDLSMMDIKFEELNSDHYRNIYKLL